jgi:hypothetical protein
MLAVVVGLAVVRLTVVGLVCPVVPIDMREEQPAARSALPGSWKSPEAVASHESASSAAPTHDRHDAARRRKTRPPSVSSLLASNRE